MSKKAELPEDWSNKFADAERPAEVICFTFPWTVVLSVDEDGYTIARFTDAPPNIHLSAHGSTAHEALTILTEIVKTWREMEAEEAAERPAPEAEPECVTWLRAQLRNISAAYESRINDVLAHIDRLTARVKELEKELESYRSNDRTAHRMLLDLAPHASAAPVAARYLRTQLQERDTLREALREALPLLNQFACVDFNDESQRRAAKLAISIRALLDLPAKESA